MRSFLHRFFGHTLVKNSTIVFIGSIAANITGWLYHVLVGGILGPEKYSELAALFALFYIINVPAGVLQTSLVKFFSTLKAKREYGQAKKLFIVATKKIALAELAGFILIIPVIPLIANFLHMGSLVYFVWLYLIFAITTISVVNGSVLQAFQLFTLSSVFANIGMVLRLVFGIISAFFGVGGALIGNVFSSIISYILSFFPLGFLLKNRSENLVLSRQTAMQYSFPALLVMFGITALYSQDILLVKHFFSNKEAGIYSYLSILGKAIYYASSAVSFVIFPLVAERTELHISYHRVVVLGLSSIGAISCGLTLAYFLFPRFVVLPFGAAFYDTMPYLGFFGIFISFFSLSSLLVNIFLGMGKTFVWIFTLGASIAQIIFISLFHTNLFMIIYINLIITGVLFSLLLTYYFYVTKEN